MKSSSKNERAQVVPSALVDFDGGYKDANPASFARNNFNLSGVFLIDHEDAIVYLDTHLSFRLFTIALKETEGFIGPPVGRRKFGKILKLFSQLHEDERLVLATKGAKGLSLAMDARQVDGASRVDDLVKTAMNAHRAILIVILLATMIVGTSKQGSANARATIDKLNKLNQTRRDFVVHRMLELARRLF